jgi:hypothetical protein
MDEIVLNGQELVLGPSGANDGMTSVWRAAFPFRWHELYAKKALAASLLHS